MLTDPRSVLERLCVERGETFAGLSELLKKNPAYIQQFVRRGVPKRLDERDRRLLAEYFSIPEAMLGGPEAVQLGNLISIARIPVRAAAGAGAIPGDEAGKPYFGFDERWLKALTSTPSSGLSIIRVDGESIVGRGKREAACSHRCRGAEHTLERAPLLRHRRTRHRESGRL